MGERMEAYTNIAQKGDKYISYRVVVNQDMPEAVGIFGRFVQFLRELRPSTSERNRIAVMTNFKVALKNGKSPFEKTHIESFYEKFGDRLVLQHRSLRASDVKGAIENVKEMHKHCEELTEVAKKLEQLQQDQLTFMDESQQKIQQLEQQQKTLEAEDLQNSKQEIIVQDDGFVEVVLLREKILTLQATTKALKTTLQKELLAMSIQIKTMKQELPDQINALDLKTMKEESGNLLKGLENLEKDFTEKALELEILEGDQKRKIQELRTQLEKVQKKEQQQKVEYETREKKSKETIRQIAEQKDKLCREDKLKLTKLSADEQILAKKQVEITQLLEALKTKKIEQKRV